MTPEQLRHHAGHACTLLKALANEDRLMLLCQLATHTRANVSELEAHTGIRQPTLSQQLGVLRQEGIVQAEKVGKYVYYSLVDPAAMQIMQTLCDIFRAPDSASASGLAPQA